MKHYLLGLSCLIFCSSEAFQYEKQLDNERISVLKITIEPNEEFGLHRDDIPQLIIATKGGTLTQYEANGQPINVDFPTGVPVYREADPKYQMHRTQNLSSDSIELIVVKLKLTPPGPENIEELWDEIDSWQE